MGDVSRTRLYLGNLPTTATKKDVEDHFNSHGTGKITEVKVMTGFGFVQYEDALDARDIVPIFHGSDFKGSRLTVQFARGPRHKENFNGPPDRPTAPRPRRTIFRMRVNGLPPDTSWQDLKDFARQSGQEVVYAETGRERDGKGLIEFESARDLNTAVEKLDNREFKGTNVHCDADIQEERVARDGGYRSRTPPRRYGPPGLDDPYDRRALPPPRGYSPRGYIREQSPRRGRYDDYGRDYVRRSPPPPRSRLDDAYGPPPRRALYEPDPYDRRPAPPASGYPDPYRGGDPYVRRPSPPRYAGSYGGYDGGPYPRRYW